MRYSKETNFSKSFYLDAACRVLHNDCGPAFISGADLNNPTYQAYYHRGLRHREGGPAVIDGEDLFWYQNDKAHNLAGPAIVLSTGEREYFLYGKSLSYAEFAEDPEVQHYIAQNFGGTVAFVSNGRIFDISPLYAGESIHGQEILARAKRAFAMLRAPTDPLPSIIDLCERHFRPKMRDLTY